MKADSQPGFSVVLSFPKAFGELQRSLKLAYSLGVYDGSEYEY